MMLLDPSKNYRKANTEKNGKSWANSQERGGVPLSQPKKKPKNSKFS